MFSVFLTADEIFTECRERLDNILLNLLKHLLVCLVRPETDRVGSWFWQRGAAPVVNEGGYSYIGQKPPPQHRDGCLMPH